MFCFVAEPCIHRDCAVTEREDAVHLGGVPDWGFCRRLEPRFGAEDHLLPLEGFWWSLRRYFSHSYLASAQSLEIGRAHV